jgi:hypothetical protein
MHPQELEDNDGEWLSNIEESEYGLDFEMYPSEGGKHGRKWTI